MGITIMRILGVKSVMPKVEPSAAAAPPPSRAQAGRPLASPRARLRLRAWLRALHRDIGYLAVGFTVIYAVSGLALNHLGDWDPSFVTVEQERTIAPIAITVPDDEAFARVQAALGLPAPRSTYRAGDELRLQYANREVTVIGDSGAVTIIASQKRKVFAPLVWLHSARNKPAWKFVADAYAVLLLYLALSGLFMIKGRLGLRWRGAVLVSIGVAIPVSYIVWAGGSAAVPPTPGAPLVEPGVAQPPGPRGPGASRTGSTAGAQPSDASTTIAPGADDFPPMRPRTPAATPTN